MDKVDFRDFGLPSSNNVDDLRKVLIEVYDNERTLVLSVPVCYFELASTLEILLRDSSNDVMIVVKKYGD